jgi:hypothetical protein
VIYLSVLTKSVPKTVRNNAQYDCGVLWRSHTAFSAHVPATYIPNNRLKWVRHAGGVPSQLYHVPAKCHTTWNRLHQGHVFYNVKVRDQGYVYEWVNFQQKTRWSWQIWLLKSKRGLKLLQRNRVDWCCPSHWCYSAFQKLGASVCRSKQGKRTNLFGPLEISILYHWTENRG